MRIAVIKETTAEELRVALTPDVVSRLVGEGCEVVVEKNAGKESGFFDEAYKNAGATIAKDAATTLKDADIITQVAPVNPKHIPAFATDAVIVSMLKPYSHADVIKKCKKLTQFSLELIPRISRAQSMDVLSSQSNLAGYRAVVEASHILNRAFPLMMTAAGTVTPVKTLVIGAGVAGLQAIATAKRLGAVVSAFDVRAAAKEQVESLGAVFVEVPCEESGEAVGGYAKEMSKAYQKAQKEKLHEVLKTQDVIITTAQIPGKAAPELITKEMVADMKPGSVIVDLAIETGGNCPLSKPGVHTTKNDVVIIAHPNMASRVAFNASQLYAKNLWHFLQLIIKKGKLHIDFEDEIIKASCLSHQGKFIHPLFKGE